MNAQYKVKINKNTSRLFGVTFRDGNFQDRQFVSNGAWIADAFLLDLPDVAKHMFSQKKTGNMKAAALYL